MQSVDFVEKQGKFYQFLPILPLVFFYIFSLPICFFSI